MEECFTGLLKSANYITVLKISGSLQSGKSQK